MTVKSNKVTEASWSIPNVLARCHPSHSTFVG